MPPWSRGLRISCERPRTRVPFVALASAGLEPMAGVIVKRPSKRRCRIPRRPHPDLEFFFSRYERRRPGMNRPDEGARPDGPELPNQMRLQNRH